MVKLERDNTGLTLCALDLLAGSCGAGAGTVGPSAVRSKDGALLFAKAWPAYSIVACPLGSCVSVGRLSQFGGVAGERCPTCAPDERTRGQHISRARGR